MPKLTVAAVNALTRPGRHSDGGNLYLKISPRGQKSWVFMYRRAGKQTELGLGSVTGNGKAGRVSLKLARDKAQRIHDVIAFEKDPIAERRREKAKAITFGQCADLLIESLKAGWKNPRHQVQWENTIGAYCKALRSRPAGAVNVEDVLAALQPIWTAKPVVASQLRSRIERVLDFAKAKGHRDGDNPARWRGHLDALLSKPKKLVKGHHAALPYRATPVFMTDLATVDAIGARALELLIYTAGRTGEVVGARWDEFDLDAAIWSVPGARMKGGRPHVVPLSAPALALLKCLPRVDNNPFVFVGTKEGKPVNRMALGLVLKDLRKTATVHGFRSAFRDWCGNETGFPREVAEECLAHVVGNAVERAYRREAAIDKRREVLAAWAGYLAGRSSNVLALAAVA